MTLDYDDDDFAGVVFQHWHVSGDERMENGSPCFAPRSVGRDLLERLFQQADDDPEGFTVRPVYWRGPNLHREELLGRIKALSKDHFRFQTNRRAWFDERVEKLLDAWPSQLFVEKRP